MNKPQIIGANMITCAIRGDGGWAALGAAVQSGGMLAVVALCNAPAVGTAVTIGIAG